MFGESVPQCLLWASKSRSVTYFFWEVSQLPLIPISLQEHRDTKDKVYAMLMGGLCCIQPKEGMTISKSIELSRSPTKQSKTVFLGIVGFAETWLVASMISLIVIVVVSEELLDCSINCPWSLTI